MKTLIKKYGILLFAIGCMSTSLYAQSKIAYVDSESIIISMPQYKSSRVILEGYGVQLRKVLADKKATFDKYYADNMEQAKLGRLTPAQQQEVETNLAKMQSDLNKDAQKSDDDYVKKDQELMQPIYDLFNKALDQVSTANAYTYILDKKSILHYKNGINASAKVRTVLGLK